jgi:hypothetical protein
MEGDNATRATFSILNFLRTAKIDENDIDRYRLFLEKWGLKNEERLRLLTRDELERFEIKYKNEHKDFELLPSDAALIAETAKNWFQTTNSTKNHS